MADKAEKDLKVYNVNVGVLGHVDSGKTSLSRALSTQSSTACFDKSPQSQERGITLDLGFSAFYLPAPEAWKEKHDVDRVQYTLVDCPGHASLIKTIIGGAQIIDMMVLVIDVTKGIQTQTAECIVIGEMLATSLIVVLNKCDMITDTDKAKYLEKMEKKLRAAFAATKFKEPLFVQTSAAPGADAKAPAVGLPALHKALQQHTPPPVSHAEEEKNLLMYIDHCFNIEGQGTVLTGTLLAGRVSVGQTVHFPVQLLDRKVKSIQMFRKPVKSARKGDRIGLSISKFDNSVERGLICAPGGNVRTYTTGVARVEKVRYFKAAIASNSKLHVTVGHATVMATVRFFCKPLTAEEAVRIPTNAKDAPAFSFDDTYEWMDEIEAEAPKQGPHTDPKAAPAALKTKKKRVIYALIAFEQPLTTPIGATLIASKLDTDITVHANVCRLCFHGFMDAAMPPADVSRIKAMKEKVKPATIDRILDDYSCIAKNLVQAKGGDLTPFLGMKINFEPPEDPEHPGQPAPGKPIVQGTVDSPFGKSGKFKVVFKDPVFRKANGQVAYPKYKLYLRFVRNHFEKSKAMVQVPLPPQPAK